MKTPKGYCVTDTGGNCDAFQRDLYAEDGTTRIGSVLITKVTDPSAPERADEPVHLGIYTVDDELAVCLQCRTTREATRIAAAVVQVQ